jgi:cell division protein FtsB
VTDDRRRPRDDAAGGWVHGAWTKPAVVVRRPDGSVVPSGERGGPDAGRGPARPRPRRIPGAPGSVLLVPTLTDLAGDPADRRLRRNAGTPATVTPLPPRPRPHGDGGDHAVGVDGPPPDEPGTPGPDTSGPDTPATEGSAAVDGTTSDRPPRPSLKVVGEALRRGAQPSADRPGGALERARGFDLDRLLPSDPEQRARLLARLRRVGVGVAAAVIVALAIYTVFPVRTALDQRAAENRSRERLEVFEREIEILEAEVEDLQTSDRVEAEAREFGLVYPGEERYGMYPAPEAPGSGAGSAGDGTTDGGAEESTDGRTTDGESTGDADGMSSTTD